jgi:hypothetical protein
MGAGHKKPAGAMPAAGLSDLPTLLLVILTGGAQYAACNVQRPVQTVLIASVKEAA